MNLISPSQVALDDFLDVTNMPQGCCAVTTKVPYHIPRRFSPLSRSDRKWTHRIQSVVQETSNQMNRGAMTNPLAPSRSSFFDSPRLRILHNSVQTHHHSPGNALPALKRLQKRIASSNSDLPIADRNLLLSHDAHRSCALSTVSGDDLHHCQHG